MKKKLFLLMFIVSFLVPHSVSATEEDSILLGDVNVGTTTEVVKPYEIKNYDIKLKLSEDYVLNVNEVVQVHFNTDDNCVIKYIPFEKTIKRKDGTNFVYTAEMSHFDSNYDYDISIANKDYKVLICTIDDGKQDKNIIIEYELEFNNNLNGEFNFEILDTRWDAPVKQLDYMIVYPKKFDPKKLQIMYDGNEMRNYTVKDVKVSGELSNLKENASVILRSDLDNNYFIKRNDYAEYNWILMFVMLLNVFIVFLIWRKNGKDLKLIDSVELYKVDNYNPLELGYISTECSKVTDKMIFSLIIYLANQGYIKMERKFNTLVLTKVKDYDGNNEIERLLMKRLFINSNEFNYTDGNRVYKKINDKIRSLIDTRENRNSIMEKQPLAVKLIPFLLGILNILITTYVVLYGRSLLLIISTIVLSILGFALLTYSLTIEDDDVQTALMLVAILLVFLSGFSTTFDIVTSNIANLLYYFIGVLSFCMIMLFIYLMPKRSKEGNVKMSRAINFREFLRTPNDELLGKLLKENKNYVYDIIAYAYAFDVEGEFLDTYNRLRGFIDEPKWYKDTTN